MEKYCIKIYEQKEKLNELKELGLRYLCKPSSGGVILFSDDWNDMLDVCNKFGISKNDAEDCIFLANEVQLDFYEDFVE